MTKVLGGAAQPVKVMTGGKRIGGPARRVYGYAAAPTDGRKVLGGPALPVVVLTDADLKENGGNYVLDGLTYAMPVYTAPADVTVMGGPAIPVYPVNAWPTSAAAVQSVVSAEIGTVNATTLVLTGDLDWSATGDDYTTGWTVNVNGSAATISSATRQSDTKVLYIVLSAALLAGDTVTADYSAVTGKITSLATFTGQAVTNNIPYWVLDAAKKTHYAGLANTSFVNSGDMTSAAGGRTFISGVISERCMQDGFIRRVFFWPTATGAVKFKVFRINGANYDFVGQSESITVTAAGSQYADLSTPIACQPGDILGIYTDATATISYATIAGTATARWADGDITTSNAFSTTGDNVSLNIEGMGGRPFLAVTGDSIPEGHNVGNSWHGFYDSGPAGTATSEIANQMRGTYSPATIAYQNMAMGSQTFAWVAATGAPAAVNSKALAVLIHCGVNDVSGARAWADIDANLDAIKLLLTSTQHLFVDEILPWTAGTDEQAATVRTYNANLATWCTANDATLIECHDAFGQTRVATGELDDLKTAYDQDGVHLTQAGVDALAAVWKTALDTYYASNKPTTPAVSSWWLQGSVNAANILTAVQAIGAASYAAAKTRVGGSTDSVDGTAYPTWDAVNGFKFNGSSQYLDTQVTPADPNTTFILRYSNFAQLVDNYEYCGSYVNGTSNFALRWNSGGNKQLSYLNGGTYTYEGVATPTNGIIAIAGKKAYLNGNYLGDIPAGGSVPALSLYVGTINISGGGTFHYGGYIQAYEILNVVLSDAAVKAISDALMDL